MKKIFIPFITIIAIVGMSCSETVKTEKKSTKELELKEKELELKEKELELKQKELALEKQKSTSEEKTKKERRLIHLFVSNGGMIGYYDDGTAVGCPRCDFLQENLNFMFNQKPTEKWDVNNPEALKVDTNEDDWALFNYEWKKDRPE